MERKEKLLFLIIHDTFALYIWLPFEGLSVCVADDNKLHWSYFILIKFFFIVWYYFGSGVWSCNTRGQQQLNICKGMRSTKYQNKFFPC